MLPQKGSNRWYLVGLAHGVLLSALFLVPLTATGSLLYKLSAFVYLSLGFIILTELLCLGGRAGKLYPWLAAALFSLVSTIIWVFSVIVARGFESLTILILGFLVVPLGSLVILLIGIIAQSISDRRKRKTLPS